MDTVEVGYAADKGPAADSIDLARDGLRHNSVRGCSGKPPALTLGGQESIKLCPKKRRNLCGTVQAQRVSDIGASGLRCMRDAHKNEVPRYMRTNDRISDQMVAAVAVHAAPVVLATKQVADELGVPVVRQHAATVRTLL